LASSSGSGWEWAALGFLAGGLWLVYTRAADLAIPVGMLAGWRTISTVFYLDRSATLRATLVSPVERRGDFRGLLHRHRSGHGQHHAARPADLRSRNWRSGLRHPGFGGYPDGVAFSGAVDEHRSADHRSYTPTPGVWSAPR
jgi:hypothetical protein